MARGNQSAAVTPAFEESEPCRPVDLVHLAKYTMGNRDLEHEVLRLFTKQSLIYLERLRNAADQRTWREAAHTLKGSARGIGAWQVAEVATALEQVNSDRSNGKRDRLVKDLCHSISEANEFIDQVLADH